MFVFSYFDENLSSGREFRSLG